MQLHEVSRLTTPQPMQIPRASKAACTAPALRHRPRIHPCPPAPCVPASVRRCRRAGPGRSSLPSRFSRRRPRAPPGWSITIADLAGLGVPDALAAPSARRVHPQRGGLRPAQPAGHDAVAASHVAGLDRVGFAASFLVEVAQATGARHPVGDPLGRRRQHPRHPGRRAPRAGGSSRRSRASSLRRPRGSPRPAVLRRGARTAPLSGPPRRPRRPRRARPSGAAPRPSAPGARAQPRRRS